ncbi:uncharacterized protein BDV17DRAFT_270132 [Aspergillus undulatus]|uniref:uncharacterized protein n=1 Tax=Aspergillus undulatus TaxID=1810928 RepID=UPI003CCD7D3C
MNPWVQRSKPRRRDRVFVPFLAVVHFLTHPTVSLPLFQDPSQPMQLHVATRRESMLPPWTDHDYYWHLELRASNVGLVLPRSRTDRR